MPELGVAASPPSLMGRLVIVVLSVAARELIVIVVSIAAQGLVTVVIVISVAAKGLVVVAFASMLLGGLIIISGSYTGMRCAFLMLQYSTRWRPLMAIIKLTCRNSDRIMGDFFAEVRLKSLLHFHKDHCRDFLGCLETKINKVSDQRILDLRKCTSCPCMRPV